MEQSGGGRLDLRAVYALIFSAEERIEYAFDNFDEDGSGKIAYEELKHTLQEGRTPLYVEELPPEVLAALRGAGETDVSCLSTSDWSR